MNKKEITNKEFILSNVREALLGAGNQLTESHVVGLTYEPFDEKDGAEFTFVRKFKDNGGVFQYFENTKIFAEALHQFVVENNWTPIFTNSTDVISFLKDNDFTQSNDYSKMTANSVILTSCDCLVARTGSVMLTTASMGSAKTLGSADTLLIIASPKQIVNEISDALKYVKSRYEVYPEQTILLTGPSHCTEIGGEDITGSHGIRRLALFFVDDWN